MKPYVKPILLSISTTKYLKNFTVEGRNYLRVLYKEKRNGVYREKIYYMSECEQISEATFNDAMKKAGRLYYEWCEDERNGCAFDSCPVEYGPVGKWAPKYKNYY